MARLSASVIILLSFVSTALTITNAFMLKKQFYPSVVYITKNSTSMAVMYFQGAVLSYLLFTFLRWVFFGQLRAAEVEHAAERVWHAIMETALAFAVFRDDFSPKFVVQFVVLFFVKAFHWLAEDRVDYMERSPVITLKFHARILGILSLLSGMDSYFISHAYFTTLMRGATAQIVFGFEYAILLTMVVHITIKYLLHMHDLRSPHPWENKAVYMLYAELLISFFRCILYFTFAVVMIKIHTFPLFAIRPFYLTIRSFQKAINDVILSRRAINAMNNLFPLATEEELNQGDNTCIICREEMTIESGPKKLPCNHIFHPNCLRSWFQRQQNCPTCRMDILAPRRPTNIIPGAQPAGAGLGAAQMGQNGQQQGPQINNPFLQRFFNVNVNQNQPQGQAGQAQQGQQNNLQGQVPPVFPFMAHNFAFPPPPHPAMAHPQVQPTQQQAGGEAQGAGEGQQQPGPSTSTGQGQAAQGPTGLPSPPPMFTPFMPMPPPPMGFMPPFMPPPFAFPQPPTFTGLTDEEVAAMEGRERANVEARIEALRNISVLLDAATLQLQQYMSVVATLGPNPIQISTNASGANGPSTSGGSAPTSTSAPSQTSPSRPDPEASPSSSTKSEPELLQADPEQETENMTQMSPEDYADLQEIRRRRLAKFEAQQAAEGQGSSS